VTLHTWLAQDVDLSQRYFIGLFVPDGQEHSAANFVWVHVPEAERTSYQYEKTWYNNGGEHEQGV